MQFDEHVQLLLGRGFSVSAHQIRHLIDQAGSTGKREEVRISVEGCIIMAKVLLLASPEEERGGERRGERGAGAEHLADERRRHVAELGQVGEDLGAPAAVATERREDETSEGREAAVGEGGG